MACSKSAANHGGAQPTARTAASAPVFAVEIIAPTGQPRVRTALVDGMGKAVTLPCSSCHSIKEPNRATRDGDKLVHFHQGLETAHGELTCLSCHDGRDYDRLHLADSTPVPFTQVMVLCRQCHGPQVRDYEHGSHGGMTGYWDRSRGKRVRNGCTVCHDPHAPTVPSDVAGTGPARPLC